MAGATFTLAVALLLEALGSEIVDDPESVSLITVPLAGFLIFLVLKHTSQTGQVLATYAITWFLLAASLVVVYFAYHRAQGRFGFRR